MRFAGLMFCGWLLGLGIGSFQPETQRVYKVYISQAFDAESRLAIAEAEVLWTRAVPSLRWVPVDSCQLGVICIDPTPTADFYTSIGVAKGTVGLTVRDPKTPTYVTLDVATLRGLGAERQCAAHELGHAMGMRHSSHRGALMYPTLDAAAPAPTPWDVAAWYVGRSR